MSSVLRPFHGYGKRCLHPFSSLPWLKHPQEKWSKAATGFRLALLLSIFSIFFFRSGITILYALSCHYLCVLKNNYRLRVVSDSKDSAVPFKDDVPLPPAAQL